MKKSGRKNKYKRGGKALEVVRQYFPKVTRVTDATSAILIEVTDKHNNSAAVKDHHACALAVACKQATKSDGVVMGITTAYVINGKTAERYKVGETTSREIVSFDRHGGFDPGVYKLHAPYESQKFGTRKVTATRRVTGTTRPELRHYTGRVRSVLGIKTGFSA